MDHDRSHRSDCGAGGTFFAPKYIPRFIPPCWLHRSKSWYSAAQRYLAECGVFIYHLQVLCSCHSQPEPLTGKVHSSTIITATKVTNTVQQEKGTGGMVEMQIKSFSQRHGLMSTAGSGSSRARYASSS